MAKDIIHNQVKNALIKDGWTITADPFRIQYEEFDLSADLSAERTIVAHKNTRKIVVEVKSFVGRSFVTEFQKAIGQFTMYLSFMKLLDRLEFELFIGISEQVYKRYFGQKAVQALLAESPMPLLVVDINREEVVKWIK